MNYLNAWRIFYSIVFSISSAEEVDVGDLELRFNALSARSHSWLSNTMNAEAITIRDQVEIRLSELNNQRTDEDILYSDCLLCAA